MSSLHSHHAIPAQVDAFSLKVRVMIDQKYGDSKKSQSNVIAFPSSMKRLKKINSHLYLEACQKLLGPVSRFFYEENTSIQALDNYLGELKEIEGHYTLDSTEQEALQVDVVHLQVAGFEHTTEHHPDMMAAYGDQLVERHFPAQYAELVQNKAISPLLKKAYADMNGMIEQCKLQKNHLALPTLKPR